MLSKSLGTNQDWLRTGDHLANDFAQVEKFINRFCQRPLRVKVRVLKSELPILIKVFFDLFLNEVCTVQTVNFIHNLLEFLSKVETVQTGNFTLNLPAK